MKTLSILRRYFCFQIFFIANLFCLNNLYLSGSVLEDEISGKKKEITTKLEELPLFKFEKLANATDNFHFGNMLGKGGFGPVYKVIFS